MNGTEREGTGGETGEGGGHKRGTLGGRGGDEQREILGGSEGEEARGGARSCALSQEA